MLTNGLYKRPIVWSNSWRISVNCWLKQISDGIIAQWLERQTHNLRVVGSSPTDPTNFESGDSAWVAKLAKRKRLKISHLRNTTGSNPVPGTNFKEATMKIVNPQMQKILLEVIAEFGMTPREINQGNCDSFCDQVMEKAHLAGIACKEMDVSGHVWVYCIDDKTHYDAETPSGVKNWKDLPYFKREFKH